MIPPMCPGLPAPDVPWVAVPGLALSHATSPREIVDGQRQPADHQIRVAGNQRDRLEILEHVVGERIDRAVDDVRAPVAEAQRVAVRRCTRDAAMGDAAGGAAVVLDDDGGAERHAHALGDDAPDGVGRAAGGGTDHNGDRPRRIGLGLRDARRGRQHGGTGRQTQKTAARNVHSRPSWRRLAAGGRLHPPRAAGERATANIPRVSQWSHLR